MKVILLEDFKNLGKKGEIVEVNNGYAKNFLLPNKIAVTLTKTSLDIKNLKEEEEKRAREAMKSDAIELKNKLDDLVLIISTTVGKEGKLFGSVSSKNIVDEYVKQFDIKLDKRKFLDLKTINTLGITKIKVELYKNVIGILTIKVIEN